MKSLPSIDTYGVKGGLPADKFPALVLPFTDKTQKDDLEGLPNLCFQTRLIGIGIQGRVWVIDVGSGSVAGVLLSDARPGMKPGSGSMEFEVGTMSVLPSCRNTKASRARVAGDPDSFILALLFQKRTVAHRRVPSTYRASLWLWVSLPQRPSAMSCYQIVTNGC